MNRVRIKRSPDPNGVFVVMGSEWDKMADAVERLSSMQVSPPLTLADNGAFVSLGANLSSATQIKYGYVNANWSSNSANLLFIKPTAQDGTILSTNVISVNLLTPASTGAPLAPAGFAVGQVIAYVPYSPTTNGTNRTSGFVLPWNEQQDCALFAVDVLQTGGSAGDQTTFCSFTYTVKSKTTGSTIATGLAPEAPRFIKCAMNAATKGFAYYDVHYNVVLACVFETNDNAPCS